MMMEVRFSERAKELKAMRKRRGMSMEELSALSGVAMATIRKIERLGYHPREDVIDRLAQVLGDEIRDLFRERGL